MSISEIIPPEYHILLTKIPENEKESFIYTYNKSESTEHAYVKLMTTIRETIDVFNS